MAVAMNGGATQAKAEAEEKDEVKEEKEVEDFGGPDRRHSGASSGKAEARADGGGAGERTGQNCGGDGTE